MASFSSDLLSAIITVTATSVLPSMDLRPPANALMIVIVQQIQRRGVAPHDVEHLTGFEAFRDAGHNASDLPELPQSLLVSGIVINDVAAKHVGGPSAELHASLRFRAIANGDDYIQIVKLRLVVLVIRCSCQGFLDNCNPLTSSPSLKQLFTCKLTFCFVVPNSVAI